MGKKNKTKSITTALISFRKHSVSQGSVPCPPLPWALSMHECSKGGLLLRTDGYPQHVSKAPLRSGAAHGFRQSRAQSSDVLHSGVLFLARTFSNLENHVLLICLRRSVVAQAVMRSCIWGCKPMLAYQSMPPLFPPDVRNGTCILTSVPVVGQGGSPARNCPWLWGYASCAQINQNS